MEVCCDPARILHQPEYRARYDGYRPLDDVVAALKVISRPVTVLIVFGYWCHDSAQVVPEVLKAVAVADNPRLQLLMLHVVYGETDPSPFMAGSVPVRRYPTVAFLEGHYQTTAEIPEGRELVRFVEESLVAERISEAVG